MTGRPSVEILVDGLRVRFVDMPGAHTTGACLRVDGGSTDDPDRPWGTAHVAEHVRIAAVAGLAPAGTGLHITGRTENTETRFTALSLPEQAGDLVAALAGLLNAQRTVGKAAFEAERHAVVLESRAAQDNPLLLLGPAVAHTCVPDSGLADTARATPRTIARVTPDHVRDFTARHYTPRSAVLAIAGPRLLHAQLAEAVAAAVGDAGAAEARPRRDPVPRPRLPLRLPPDLDGLFVLAVPATGAEPGGSLALRTLTSAGGPIASRLARAGHPLVGRATITGAGHEVGVMCWRAAAAGTAPAGLVADALHAAARGESDFREAWRTTALLRHQERAFAESTPVGRAQATALDLPPVPPPAAPPLTNLPDQDEQRRTAARARMWHVRSGTLNDHDPTES